MKKFYTLVLTVLSVCSFQFTQAQCNGIKGPNLLGAKGTFSAPFITVNASAGSCTGSGSSTYNPTGNIGNGTRDTLCRRDLMEAVVDRLRGRWTMHWLEGADHGFHVLKSSGRSYEDVLGEIAQTCSVWASDLERRTAGPP